METTQISIHRWMNKQNGEHAHDGIWPTHEKNEVLARAGHVDKPWKHANMPNIWKAACCLIPFDRPPVILDGPVIKESACRCRRRKRQRFDPWVRQTPWSRKWQPTPLFWSGEFHGQGSLVGYNSWDHKSQTQLNTVIIHPHQLCTRGPASLHDHLHWVVCNFHICILIGG